MSQIGMFCISGHITNNDEPRQQPEPPIVDCKNVEESGHKKWLQNTPGAQLTEGFLILWDQKASAAWQGPHGPCKAVWSLLFLKKCLQCKARGAAPESDLGGPGDT